MHKYEQLNNMLEDGNGYLFTEDVVAAGISRTYLGKFAAEKGLERVVQGVYLAPDTWNDELFILQRAYPDIVFSGETALYLHGLTDREYLHIYVTVPSGFNRSRLTARGILVHQEPPQTYMLGITEVQTGFGHSVRAYNKERCICNLIKERKKAEVQTYQTAIKTYMRSKDRRLTELAQYAAELNIRDELMKYVEVLV